MEDALDSFDQIAERLAYRDVLLFLDFDGTLAPIVDDPAAAAVPESERPTLSEVVRRYPTAVISGRDLPDVRRRVGLDGVVYAGSHGFDIEGPDIRREQPDAIGWLPVLEQAEQRLRQELEAIDGVLIERKRFALAIHYRKAPPERVAGIRERVDAVAGDTGLSPSGGKMVFELRPPVAWDKGHAVAWLSDLMAAGTDTARIYIGDDVTDEDAFAVLTREGDITIRVGESSQETSARFSLTDTRAVLALLERLTALPGQSSEAGGEAAALDPWRLVYHRYDPLQEPLREALCTLGNGYFATRGAFPGTRARDCHYPGTYLAGGYNRRRTTIEGTSVENESLVNLPDWLVVRFQLPSGEWFHPDSVDLIDYRQVLDLATGVLERRLRFRDRFEQRFSLCERRLVHITEPHLAGVEVTLVPESGDCEVQVLSALEGRVSNQGVERYRRLAHEHLEALGADAGKDGSLFLGTRFNDAGLEIAQAARHRLLLDGRTLPVSWDPELADRYAAVRVGVTLRKGQRLRLEKVVTLYSGRDRAIYTPAVAARNAAARAAEFGDLLTRHRDGWRQLWDRFDMVLKYHNGEGNDSARILRLHLFHTLQTASPNTLELDVGVPARGLHGEAYRGHIFWDELFVFPLLNLRMPELTRSLLHYRFRRLDEARAEAEAAGFRGALYPWQSGSNGREESQRLHLNPRSNRWIPDNSWLQRHAGLAVAYNIWQYFQATGDREFMSVYGAPMLLEIARFWASIAQWNPERTSYDIRGVMGPDEYHDAYPDAEQPGLDNNAYTNVMAAWALCRARELLDFLPVRRCRELRTELQLDQPELEHWDDVSRNLFVPFHQDGRIISQFEGYESLREFPWEKYRERYGDIQRLDRILEAEGDSPNRYRASKQADVLMLFYLLSREELEEIFRRLGYGFDAKMLQENVEYYLQRTSHGSTLSGVVHAWVLARLDRSRSWQLFNRALESDVADVQGGTTPEGIHLGAMAGSADMVQRCYTGLVTRNDRLLFNPNLPEELASIHLRLRYRGHDLRVAIETGAITVGSEPGPAGPIRIGVDGDERMLRPGAELRLSYSTHHREAPEPGPAHPSPA